MRCLVREAIRRCETRITESEQCLNVNNSDLCLGSLSRTLDRVLLENMATATIRSCAAGLVRRTSGYCARETAGAERGTPWFAPHRLETHYLTAAAVGETATAYARDRNLPRAPRNRRSDGRTDERTHVKISHRFPPYLTHARARKRYIRLFSRRQRSRLSRTERTDIRRVCVFATRGRSM